MKRLVFSSQSNKEVIDITSAVQDYADDQSVDDGVILLFLMHTSAAITTCDLDPGSAEDYLEAFRAVIPKLNYRHQHDPGHMPDHIISTLIGASLTIPVENEKLVLGQWQRIVLFEFSGPRDRTVIASHIREQK